MTTLEIILIAIIWIAYGVFNAKQHDWHYLEDDFSGDFFSFINIMGAPIALIIRIFRGIFIWKGDYE